MGSTLRLLCAFVVLAGLTAAGAMAADAKAPAAATAGLPVDPELSNRRSGISLFWAGTKGVDYVEEYFYHDKSINDRKVVFLRDTTRIVMETNEWNTLSIGPKGPGQPIGKEGMEVESDPNTPRQRLAGTIRFLVDHDGSDALSWGPTKDNKSVPEYTQPFRFADLSYEPGVPVVGTTGPNGPLGKQYYHRGNLDDVGDEWHTIDVGHDDAAIMPHQKAEQQASDGKEFIFVVNPKTPALVVRATGNAQFYTTPPKMYGVSRIFPQTTYIQPGTGGISITVSALGGGAVAYRVNGGDWQTGRDAVLADSAFRDGTNALEYRFSDAKAPLRVRTVVKNPTHPSRAEPHGNFLWVDDAEFKKIRERLDREPYQGVWKALSTTDDQTNQAMWDSNGLTEWRRPWFKAQPNYHGMHPSYGGAAMPNAFVAAVKGWDFAQPGKQKSYGRYAKEMVLRNLFGRLDPIRFYGNQAGGPNPSTELVGAGYYMVNIVFDTLPAYDIVAGRFRSDQVADGLTPIEDFYVRDTLAHAPAQMAFIFEKSGGKTPGLWTTGRVPGALMVAAALPEYSSACYGTSGFGKAKPPEGKLSWKTWLTTTKYQSPTYPGTTIPVFDPEEPALWREGGIWGGPNRGYFSLLSRPLNVLLNINARYAPQTRYPVIEQGMANAIGGTLTTIKGEPGGYLAQPCLGNRYFPTLGPASVKAIKAKGDEAAQVRSGGLFGLIWYDDTLTGAP